MHPIQNLAASSGLRDASFPEVIDRLKRPAQGNDPSPEKTNIFLPCSGEEVVSKLLRSRPFSIENRVPKGTVLAHRFNREWDGISDANLDGISSEASLRKGLILHDRKALRVTGFRDSPPHVVPTYADNRPLSLPRCLGVSSDHANS